MRGSCQMCQALGLLFLQVGLIILDVKRPRERERQNRERVPSADVSEQKLNIPLYDAGLAEAAKADGKHR